MRLRRVRRRQLKAKAGMEVRCVARDESRELAAWVKESVMLKLNGPWRYHLRIET